MERLDPFLDAIPAVGAEILYKTFRGNSHLTTPIYDIKLEVVSISFEIEEDWNKGYKRTCHIYCTELSRTEIPHADIFTNK